MRAPLDDGLRRLWDAGIAGMATGTTDGHLRDANDAFLELIGYTRAELEAGELHWRALVVPGREVVTPAKLEELVASGRLIPYETELVHKDGRRVPILLGVATLSSGPTPELIAFAVDQSRRKQLEAQLQQAQRLESVGLLAGGVAHDLNNVLAAILLCAECVNDSLPAGHDGRDDLAQIRRVALSAGGIIRQLLAFSREQMMLPRVLELGGVAVGMESMLRRLLGEGLGFSIRTSATRNVHADMGQLEQVIMNLLVNARDATPDGGSVTIDVLDHDIDPERAAALGVPAGAYVELRVTDTGCGMDAATMSRIFEPFFTTKEVGRGTGLGLSTVFGIVRQSGGAVWADSAVGQGTTFHIVLPAVRAMALSVGRGDTHQPLSRGERILIVDDEATIGRALQRILDRAGYHTTVVVGAGDALLVAERMGTTIDLMIADICMPLLNGPALRKRMLAQHPGLRTLFITGFASTYEDLGGAPVMLKPFAPTEILAKVRELLDGDAVGVVAA